jgi:hypothetical protein
MLRCFLFIQADTKAHGHSVPNAILIRPIINYLIARDVMLASIPVKTIRMLSATPVIQEVLADEKYLVMRNTFLLFIIIVFCVEMNGQTSSGYLTGKVSFVSPSNIYVKFISTQGISAGDTLFTLSGEKIVSVLKVNNLSSTSCVCSLISMVQISVGDQILARKKNTVIINQEKPVAINQNE